MSKTKELIICIVVIIALILSITTNIFATSIDELLGNMNNPNYQTIPNSTNQGIIDINGTNNINTNNILPENTNTNINTNTNTNTNLNTSLNINNNTNSIPYTGVNNFSIIAIIAVCGVVAVYAYKKIRDYNA